MFLRIDRLQVEMPLPQELDPTTAAVQELMGGRSGKMTTLNNYMYQGFNFREQASNAYRLLRSGAPIEAPATRARPRWPLKSQTKGIPRTFCPP